MSTKNIMIVGVGGQGTLLTSRILGGLAIDAGYDVKLSEVHGMAQRGGSVVTFVRFGDKVYEPVVEEGEVDVLTLKDILGHEQLTTTQIYTHVVDRNLEEAMANNPLSDVKIKAIDPEEDL